MVRLINLMLMLHLFRFNTEEEALAIANSSPVGLAGLSMLISTIHPDFDLYIVETAFT